MEKKRKEKIIKLFNELIMVFNFTKSNRKIFPKFSFLYINYKSIRDAFSCCDMVMCTFVFFLFLFFAKKFNFFSFSIHSFQLIDTNAKEAV